MTDQRATKPVVVYCLWMDSGAAWHVDPTDEVVTKCPTSGCGLGHVGAHRVGCVCLECSPAREGPAQ